MGAEDGAEAQGETKPRLHSALVDWGLYYSRIFRYRENANLRHR